MPVHSQHAYQIRLRATALSLGLLLVLGQALASADPTSIAAKIGNRDFVIPGPPGYFEITASREQVKRLFEAGATSGNRHVAAFAPPAEVRSIDAGGPLRQWAVVQVVRSIEYKAIDAQQFQGLRSTTRSRWIDTIKQVENRLGRELNEASARIASEIDLDVAFEVDNVVPIGIFLDRPDAIGIVMLTRSETKTPKETYQATIFGTMTFLHVKDRVICVYVYNVRNESGELELIKSLSTAWADAVQASNKGL